MKLKYFLVTVLAMASFQARADLGASVMLRHNGQAKFYQWDEVQKAVDDAVDGDTIYLTEGNYAPFNINKRIMVRGAGPATMVEGRCIINIPNDQKLVMPVLDAVNFSENVHVNSAGRQLTLRKVKMSGLTFWDAGGGDIEDMKLDRCYISSRMLLPKKVRSLNCNNCNIWELQPGDHTNGSLTFNHCNILAITDTITAQFNSCVIRYARTQRGSYYYSCLIGCVLNSCLYTSTTSSYTATSFTTGLYLNNSVTMINCQQFTAPNNDGDIIGYSSTNHISSLDGTMIGCFGGQYPFNRNPDLPMVTKHAVKVDAANKKLNVTLTLDKK